MADSWPDYHDQCINLSHAESYRILSIFVSHFMINTIEFITSGHGYMTSYAFQHLLNMVHK